MHSQNYTFKHPTTFLLSGSSQSGKTQWTSNLLQSKAELFEPQNIGPVYLFYKEWQEKYDIMSNDKIVSTFHKGVPNQKDFLQIISKHKNENGCVCIFDDLADEITRKNNLDFNQLFTVYSHHYKVTVILILHYLFDKGLRKISLNTQHIVFTDSPRDKTSISYLARQVFPNTGSYLIDSYKDALTTRAYGYIVISIDPGRDDILRVATSIFKHQHPIKLYKINNNYKDDANEDLFEIMYLIDDATYFSSILGNKNAKNIVTVNTQYPSNINPSSLYPHSKHCESSSNSNVFTPTIETDGYCSKHCTNSRTRTSLHDDDLAARESEKNAEPASSQMQSSEKSSFNPKEEDKLSNPETSSSSKPKEDNSDSSTMRDIGNPSTPPAEYNPNKLKSVAMNNVKKMFTTSSIEQAKKHECVPNSTEIKKYSKTQTHSEASPAPPLGAPLPLSPSPPPPPPPPAKIENTIQNKAKRVVESREIVPYNPNIENELKSIKFKSSKDPTLPSSGKKKRNAGRFAPYKKSSHLLKKINMEHVSPSLALDSSEGSSKPAKEKVNKKHIPNTKNSYLTSKNPQFRKKMKAKNLGKRAHLKPFKPEVEIKKNKTNRAVAYTTNIVDGNAANHKRMLGNTASSSKKRNKKSHYSFWFDSE